ncbi:hypothetical protein OAV88_03645 [bacterium]|nr:hypothetical protein [bacterium]
MNKNTIVVVSLSLCLCIGMNELKLICGSGQPERFLSLSMMIRFSELCVYMIVVCRVLFRLTPIFLGTKPDTRPRPKSGRPKKFQFQF